MGAVPKRKISKGRKNRRRAQDGLAMPAMSTCPKCNQVKRPHYRCDNCGHYGPMEQPKAQAATAPSKKRNSKTNEDPKRS